MLDEFIIIIAVTYYTLHTYIDNVRQALWFEGYKYKLNFPQLSLLCICILQTKRPA